MRARSFLRPAFVDSEVTRYLGWPAKAICYKVDALRLPFYSSRHPTGSHVGGTYLIWEIPTNQATIWAIYRALGKSEPVRGYGKLLESLATVRA